MMGHLEHLGAAAVLRERGLRLGLDVARKQDGRAGPVQPQHERAVVGAGGGGPVRRRMQGREASAVERHDVAAPQPTDRYAACGAAPFEILLGRLGRLVGGQEQRTDPEVIEDVGKPADMVAHLVHKDEAGKLAVVAVLIRKGKENAALKAVFDNMPVGAGPVHSVEGLSINVADLLPAKRGYYHFEGSLTTPPCSEGVSWYVLSTPVEASAAQIKSFQALYRHNARPVQPLNDRAVVERAG